MQANKRLASAAIFALVLCVASDIQAAERAFSFAVSGIVEKILVTAGDEVSAGDVLAEMDATKIKARLKAGQSAEAAAQLSYDIMKRRYDYATVQFEAVSLSQAELDEAKLAMANAQAGLARIRSKIAVGNWYLDHMTLRAPASGRVVKVPGYVGMIVNLKTNVSPIIVMDVAE